MPLQVLTLSNLVATSSAPGTVETFHGACDANNIVNSANNGGALSMFTAIRDTQVVLGDARTAYECCVLCQTLAEGCKYALYQPHPVTPECFLSVARLQETDVCSPGEVFGEYQTGRQPPNAASYAVSNGPCGRVRNKGTNS